MKRYTLRGLIHDAKVFYQLRLEYRRTSPRRRSQIAGHLHSYFSDFRGPNPEFGKDDFAEVIGRTQLMSRNYETLYTSSANSRRQNL